MTFALIHHEIPSNVLSRLLRAAMRVAQTIFALSLLVTISACASQAAGTNSRSARQQDQQIVNGDAVSALDNCIFVIYQAKDGTYWFGSDKQGVYHYDGKSFVHFTTQHGLRGNSIRSIQEDRWGNIFVGSNGGVSRFDGKTFRALDAADGGQWRLAADDLWFAGSQDEGIVYRYDGKTLFRLAFPKTKAGEEFIAKYPRAQFPNMTYNPYDVYVIFKDDQKNIWFGTGNLGACRYDGKTFAWAKTEINIGENDSFGLRSIAQDKSGKFWFTTTLNRFDIHPSTSNIPIGQQTGSLSFEKEPGIRYSTAGEKNQVVVFMSAVNDKNGDTWMATLYGGVWRFDGSTLTHYPVKDGDADVSLYSIYKDRQDVLWLGTHEHGTFKFNGTKFERFGN